MISSNEYTIFIVEDSDTYRSLLAQALVRENETLQPRLKYNIYGFPSGEECLENLYLRPDVVVLDYFLNGNGYEKNMNGLSLLRQIKKRLPNTEVIMMSCQQSIEVVKKLMSSGIREYISKGRSVDQYRVTHAVSKVIEDKEYRKKEAVAHYSLAAFIIFILALFVWWLL